MSALSGYDIPFNQLESQMVAWATEAIELRFGSAGDEEGRVELPAFEQGALTIIASLSRVRQRLDRTEELQSKALQARGRLIRMQAQARHEAEEVYNNAASHNARFGGMTVHGTYTSAKERDADAKLASLEQRRSEHQAERLVSVAQEVEEQIKHCYWGLTKLREDHLTFLRRQENLTTEEVTT